MPNPGMQCNQIRPPMACDVGSKEVPNLLTFRKRPAGWTQIYARANRHRASMALDRFHEHA
jgi:hypothetical protein